MKWVFLSPHFDDVVLSCGGLAWEQAHSGHAVEIWTLCAGAPAADGPFSGFVHELHTRWQTGVEAVPVRRQEDEAAGRMLGVQMRYWDLPDCIYRRLPDGSFLVNGEEDLWKSVHPQEAGVVDRLKQWLSSGLDADTQLVSPMTLGNHVDHRLVRQAAEGVVNTLWYYPDFPYVVQYPDSLPAMLQPEWRKECFQVSRHGLTAWQQAISEYTSQISTFWGSIEQMERELEAYWTINGGGCLWRRD